VRIQRKDSYFVGVYKVFQSHLLIASEYVPLGRATKGIHVGFVEAKELNIVE
tara:strand:+ start:837 stop:992 length:156 start_codon:yes stop_codon:yes gene_type:complete